MDMALKGQFTKMTKPTNPKYLAFPLKNVFLAFRQSLKWYFDHFDHQQAHNP